MSSNAAINNALPAMAGAAGMTSGYKATVFLYLPGGNDGHNTVYPVNAPYYERYRAPRPDIAFGSGEGTLLNVTAGSQGRTLRMHPAMPKLAARFNAGKMAILANVGMLSKPLTRAQWLAGPAPQDQPINLFSHSDQALHWSTLTPNDQGQGNGWGGRAMDLFDPAWNPSKSVSTRISVAGNTMTLVGYDDAQYQCGVDGAQEIGYQYFPAVDAALKNILNEANTNVFERAYERIEKRSRVSASAVNTALAAVPALQAAFPGSYFGSQLKMVARLIQARGSLGHRRDVFYVSLGGWDHHSNQRSAQNDLLAAVDNGLDAFRAAMEEIGQQDNVVLCTGSDFGRTLQQNGDGTDHGWGSHHLILGGNVKGGVIHGTFPDCGLDTDCDAGQGRLLPTTSVDEYIANIARWMGVPPSAVPAMIPNIGKFPNTLNMFN
ncbi:MAG: DUF1501 domain-containing protein [Proteobacteria bacterium]|nr:MAG: DUF1501 domain-containing protein [Pseudomonadota bacterium]